jgi:peptide/nickel transport system substrate-binding protein
MSTDRVRVTDPAAITDAASAMLSLNAFQRLMTADPGQSVLKPDAARDCLFTSSTSYTCTLNDDLAFHNGHPSPPATSSSASSGRPASTCPARPTSLMSSLRRIETPDDKTIRFVLSRVDTQFGWAWPRRPPPSSTRSPTTPTDPARPRRRSSAPARSRWSSSPTTNCS